jgi:1,4-alpha-glucan branching enzyme
MKTIRSSQKKRFPSPGSSGGAVGKGETPIENKDTPEPVAGTRVTPAFVEPVSERFPALEEEEIVLTYLAPEAKSVYVAGAFNAWDPEATPLKNMGVGEWVVRLMLRSGRYEYRFVVDGQWIDDPEAVQRVANPHGGFNSVLIVPLEVRTSIL